MIIDNFIQLGWHTVPLNGTIKRLDNGKKTIPKLELNYTKKYAEIFSKKQTRLAGALTGKISNFVAVDCDNKLTYDIFKSLDPDYTFRFDSIGKEGGTIIYSYTPEIPSFRYKTDLLLDFISDRGFIFLPTEDNFTKNCCLFPVEIKPIPDTVFAVLKELHHKTKPIISNESKSTGFVLNKLEPILTNVLKEKKYNKDLFKIITPKTFRDLPQYLKENHLHPNNVPDGRGSEYLSKVSAILGADSSVSIKLYQNAILYINSLWDNPIADTKLKSTIIDPMIEGRSSINGESIWRYNSDWRNDGIVYTTKKEEYIESFFDDRTAQFYIVNYTVPFVKTFTDKSKCINYISTVVEDTFNRIIYDKNVKLKNAVLDPVQEFGAIDNNWFNLFRSNKNLDILKNPNIWASNYTTPEITIKFFETFIPNEQLREYFLRFILTRFTTFNRSMVTPCFVGVSGSGKGVLMTMLKKILNEDYIYNPTLKMFMEKHNAWLFNCLLAHLDEYGDEVTNRADRKRLTQQLKAYTGNDSIALRAMNTDGKKMLQNTTFILTSNSNPLVIEELDRRFLYINTPNVMKYQDWAVAAGGGTAVYNTILNTIPDFCYWLATTFEPLSLLDYFEPPYNDEKEQIIFESMPPSKQLVYYIATNNFDKLVDLFIEHRIPDFDDLWNVGRLRYDKLEDLFMAITENSSIPKILKDALREKGFKIERSTYKNSVVHFILIPKLKQYKENNMI